jgi:peptide-methionine (R)-S-oxide reductase
MKNLLLLLTLFSLSDCQGQKKDSKKTTFEVVKTESEWKTELSPQQYEVLRKKGTEQAFTGEYWDHFEKGTYVCAACKTPLFNSQRKYESDCGWPSFDQAIKGSVIYQNDYSFGMSRVEVLCAKCGGHLGHIFDDGPKNTTGKRFCTNSVSILFIPEKK